MFAIVFMAAAVLSAESMCTAVAQLSSCASGMQGGTSCSTLDEYISCVENKLSSCDKSFKETMVQQLKSQATLQPAFANCGKSSPSPSPSVKPNPSPSPTPAEEASSAACTSLNLPQKMTECQGPLMQAAASGNVCGGWNSFQCCLIDSAASCGKAKQEEVKAFVTQTSSTFKQMGAQFAALDGCGAATCAGAPAPVPEKVTALMADITLSKPGDFDLETFKAAVKERTGATDVQVVLKGFEILATYGLMDTMDLSQLKAAIAKANSVQESQISVENSGRRLSAQRLLATKATDIDVTITVPDKEKAAAVKESAKDVTKLTNELGQDVALSKAPEAIAKVETTLTSDPSLATDTLTSKMTEAGADVGGTITVKEMPQVVPQSSGSSSFGALLAPVMTLLTVMLAM